MFNIRNRPQNRTMRQSVVFSPVFVAVAALFLLSGFPQYGEAVPAASAGNTLKLSDYPAFSAVPPVDSPQVKKWLSEIDLSGAPSFPPNSGEPPTCPEKVDPNVCYWTCDDCSSDDVVDCPDKNTWGLTFDDGPTPATPDLLKFLDAQKLKATFFLIGTNVIQHPSIVMDEIKAGHHLASHTWSHHALTTLSNEQIVAEMKWTEKAIEEATGYRVRYMRPPYGDVDNRVRFVLRKLGYTIVDWTGDAFDSQDWQMPEISQSQVITNFEHAVTRYTSLSNGTTSSSIKRETKPELVVNATKGFISLEHDLTSQTVAVAKTLIPFGMKHNLQIMSVAQCLHDNSPYAAVNGKPTAGPAAAPNSGNTSLPASNTDGLDLNQHKNGASGSLMSVRSQHFMGDFYAFPSFWSTLFLGSLIAGSLS
ncbi:chitin deacetylase, partial [Haplosporangium sp. Z 27]